MNEEIKEFLTKIINSEPKKGMIVNVEVKEIYGKDIMTILFSSLFWGQKVNCLEISK